MNGVNVKNAISAIEVAKRVQKVLGSEGSRVLADLLTERGKQAKDGSELGRAFERGYEAGLNDGCRVANVTVDALDVQAVVDAVYGSE